MRPDPGLYIVLELRFYPEAEWEGEEYRPGVETPSRCFTKEERHWVMVGGKTNGRGRFSFSVQFL